MNIANMLFQSNTVQSHQNVKQRNSNSNSFESMLSKVGDSKPKVRDESPKAPSVAVKDSSQEKGKGESPESQTVKAEEGKKTLSEKLKQLETAIANGDSEQVEIVFSELMAFLGIDFSGIDQSIDLSELAVQVDELLVKLEELVGENVKSGLSALDLKNIESGLEMVKEIIAPLKGENNPVFKELSLKLEELSSKLGEAKQSVESEGLEAKVVLKDEKPEPQQVKADVKTEETELDVTELGLAEQDSESETSELNTEVKGIKAEKADEVEVPKVATTMVEFEKISINQNMRAEMNQNMHTVLNKEVNVEQNYLNMDKLDIIKQISAKMKLNGGDIMNEIKMKLTPESLGELTIKVTLERGIISARAIVENPYVKQIMESNMAELKQNLKSQGINFDQIDVFVGEDPDERRQAGESYQEQNRKKKRTVGGIEELELEEAGRILGEDIMSSERVDTII